jgi:hypothetical protein
MREVKMRYMAPGLAPRRTRMEIPGWAGDRSPRADVMHEQIWHCTPFTEGAQYGIEIFYPFDFELRAVTRDGRLHIEGDFGAPPEPGAEWPPFRSFGDLFYTHQVLLDINPGPGFAIRTEPHPRFYSDTTGTCPIAVPALIRNWWPMMFFMVFKSPPEGQTHIFRPGEPMAQILVIPETAEFDLVEMSLEEQAERELRSRRIYAARSTVTADTTRTSATRTVFDGTYRHMARAAKAKAAKGSEGT